MKRITKIFLSFLPLLPLACSPLEGDSAKRVTILVSLDLSSTKVTGSSYSGENDIAGVQVFTFDRTGLCDGYTNITGVAEGVVETVTGLHDVYVVANSGADLSGVRTREGLLASVQDLASQSPGSLVLVGRREGFDVKPNASLTLSVHHFVSRVVLRKITNRLSVPALAEKEFRVLDVYLTNVPGDQTFALDAAPSLWHNRTGLESGLSAPLAALLHDRVPEDSQVVPLNASHETEHRFYFIPNLVEDGVDVFSDDWAPRHTRLVVRASIGGEVFYYPLTLPCGTSNESFEVDELVIARQGTLREESVLPYTAVSFDATLVGMDGQEGGLEFRASRAVVVFAPQGVDPMEFVSSDVPGSFVGVPMIVFGDGAVSPFAYLSRMARLESVSGTVLFFSEPGIEAWSYVESWSRSLAGYGHVFVGFEGLTLEPFVRERREVSAGSGRFLRFDVLSDGDLFWLAEGSMTPLTVQYSLNGGAWMDLTATLSPARSPLSLHAGDVLLFRGGNGAYAVSGTDYCHFLFETPGVPGSPGCGIRASGDVRSLLSGGLKPYCFAGLFRDCTSLVSAPDLLGAALPAHCYSHMFSGCSSLTRVRCLALVISAEGCLDGWLEGVSPSGTFVRARAFSGWPSGPDGIPAGWTVEQE